MELTHPDIALQAGPLTLRENRRENALMKIFASDSALAAQFFLMIPLIAAGIAFHITVLQWFLVAFVTFISIICGIFRAAALLQVKRDLNITAFHETRIRTMGNALVAVSAGISFITYLLIFTPAILRAF
jgi:diacylglycerol kinase